MASKVLPTHRNATTPQTTSAPPHPNATTPQTPAAPPHRNATTPQTTSAPAHPNATTPQTTSAPAHPNASTPQTPAAPPHPNASPPRTSPAASSHPTPTKPRRARRAASAGSGMPSRQSLDEVPFRALRFLRAVAGSPDIARALASRGYGAAEHDGALRLLVRAFPWSAPPPPEDDAGRESFERATAWYRANVGVLRATLERRHPAVAARLFARLSPSAPDDRNMFFLLSALVALAKDPAAKPVLALLEQRGIRASEVAALLRDVARLPPRSKAHAPSAESVVDETAPRSRSAKHPAEPADAHLIELFRFLQEWTGIARATVTRRDHLVRLGLAERRRPLPPIE